MDLCTGRKTRRISPKACSRELRCSSTKPGTPVKLSVAKRQSVDIGDLESTLAGVNGDALLGDAHRVSGAIDRNDPRLRIALANCIVWAPTPQPASIRGCLAGKCLAVNEFGQNAAWRVSDLLRCRIAVYIGVGHAPLKINPGGFTAPRPLS